MPTTTAEQHAAAETLGMPIGEFQDRFVGEMPVFGAVYGKREDGACVFLGEDNRCRIYESRPQKCRTYPYWPEHTEDRMAWNREAKECPGMIPV